MKLLAEIVILETAENGVYFRFVGECASFYWLPTKSLLSDCTGAKL